MSPTIAPGPVPVGGLSDHGGRSTGQAIWRVIGLVPAIVFILCSVSADLVAIFGGDPLGIWQILPAGPVTGDWVGAELSSTAFLLIGLALFRRKRAGFWLGLSVACGALFVQGANLDHPVAALAAAAMGAILLATRQRYDVRTGRGVLVGGLVAFGALLVAVAAAPIPDGTDLGGMAVDALGALLDLATPVALPGMATVGAILLLARVAYVLATALALEPVNDERSPEVVAAARLALRRLGRGSLLPYQLGPGCVAVADEHGTAVIAVALAGRTVVVLGDPAGEPAGDPAGQPAGDPVGDPAGDPAAGVELVNRWARGCRQRDLVPAVYQASATTVRWLRPSGWHAVQIGREAMLDPVTFDLGAAAVANLRHTVVRSRRGGIRIEWSATGLAGLADPRLAGRMTELDAAWRRTAGPRLGFTVGRFDPSDREPSAVAVALAEEGRPVAFVVLRPTGADGGWMLDVMRRARDSVPGAVEACLVAAIQELASLGVRRLSLGLAPLAGLDAPGGRLAERTLARGARLIRPLYDHEGLAFFKNKFGPTWEPRYLLVGHWLDLPPAVVALLRLHLGGSWPRVVRSVLAGLAPAR